MQISLRYTLDQLVAPEGALFQWKRHMAETTGIVCSTLAVALVFPSYAEKIFAITGATAVCIVCYVLPVALHLKLRAVDSIQQSQNSVLDEEEQQVHALLLPGNADLRDTHVSIQECQHSSGSSASTLRRWYQYVCDVVLPVVVVLLGVSLSLAALFTTCESLFSLR